MRLKAAPITLSGAILDVSVSPEKKSRLFITSLINPMPENGHLQVLLSMFVEPLSCDRILVSLLISQIHACVLSTDGCAVYLAQVNVLALKLWLTQGVLISP